MLGSYFIYNKGGIILCGKHKKNNEESINDAIESCPTSAIEKSE